MGEHVCEWRITCAWSDEYKMNVPKVYCRIGDCGEELPIKSALARLNATEMLSAEDARVIADKHDGKTKAILLAYVRILSPFEAWVADTLEGK